LEILFLSFYLLVQVSTWQEKRWRLQNLATTEVFTIRKHSKTE